MGAREGLVIYMEMRWKIFKRNVVEGMVGIIQHQSYSDDKVLEEVIKTCTGNIELFNTSCIKEVHVMAFVSSFVTTNVHPTCFQPSLPSHTAPTSPSGKSSWPAVQLLDTSHR